MLLSLAYSLARLVADLCLVRMRSDAQLRDEVLALHHQLRVLKRIVAQSHPLLMGETAGSAQQALRASSA